MLAATGLDSRSPPEFVKKGVRTSGCRFPLRPLKPAKGEEREEVEGDIVDTGDTVDTLDTEEL